MDKILAKKFAEESFKSLEPIAAKYGLKIKYRGGKFSSFDFAPKFVFEVPITADNIVVTDIPDENFSNEMIKMGLASRGTQVKLHNGKIATILSARRKKYVIDIDGKEFLINFQGCSAIK